jgi:hypothetical protein
LVGKGSQVKACGEDGIGQKDQEIGIGQVRWTQEVKAQGEGCQIHVRGKGLKVKVQEQGKEE